MDKWKKLLKAQVGVQKQLKKSGIKNPDPTLFEELCLQMTRMGYDVPKLLAKFRYKP